MRLGSLTLSATMSVALLSGCSFIGGQSGQTKNPFANQQASQFGQFGPGAVNQRCQIPTPRHPIPRGCRPEHVTIGVPQAYGAPSYAANGFPQQPQFGQPQFAQPQFATGGFGAAVGQTPALAQHTAGPRKRKPRLRGSLSLGIERSFNGDLFAPSVRNDLDPSVSYNPQDFNEEIEEGTEASGLVTTTTFTANEADAANIFAPNTFESSSVSAFTFEDVWSTPLQIKGGLEYIVNDRTTVFANAGHTYSAGNEADAVTVDASIYQNVVAQPFIPQVDAAGAAIPGAFRANGNPEINTTFIPNQRIATFAYDFSDLRQYDLEVGARQYFNPIIKSDDHRTVTPFVGASVGVSYVNDVDVTVSQTQTFYQETFNGNPSTFDVPSDGEAIRLYDSEWLPQAQVNFGAEWQLTPGFALAAETGLKFQASRDYADFENAAGETIEGANGDLNISIPLTLRGSVNF